MAVQAENPPSQGEFGVEVRFDEESKLILLGITPKNAAGMGIGLSVTEAEWVIRLLIQAVAQVKGITV